MKNIRIIAAAAACLVTPFAFSQTSNFEGFSVLGGVNLGASTFEQNAKNGSSLISVTSTSSNFLVQGEYTFAIGSQITLGLGATVGLGDLTFGRWASGTGGDIKLKETYSAYIAPGYLLNETTLVYAKLASISGTAYDNSGSLSLSGIGYGAGARFLSNKNMYYQIEFIQNQYQDKDLSTVIDKFRGSIVSFGAGYKF
jgi:opacity protein-like surface antigen